MLAHARSQKHQILSLGIKILFLLKFEDGKEGQQDLPSVFQIKTIMISQLVTHGESTRTMLNQR